jgi:hypothetical protein
VPVTRWLALAFLLLTGACSSTPGDRGSRELAKKPLRGGVLEFRVTSYDGHDLKARVLLGATIDPIVLDGRLYENLDVELRNARACGKTEVLKHWVWETLHPPPRPDQLVTLNKGYWYGADLYFPLFDEESSTGPGPDCFEADLVMLDNDARVAAKLPIRVARTDKPPAQPNGITQEPKGSPSEAGAP